jgi:hypothetical protein
LIAEGHADSSRELLVTVRRGKTVVVRSDPQIVGESTSNAVTEGWNSPDKQVSGPDIFVMPKTSRGFRAPSLQGRRKQAKQARIAQSRANHPSQQARLHLVEDEELETTRISLRRAFEDVSAVAVTPGSSESVTG